VNAPVQPLSNLLTNSRVATQRACARKHYFRYELGVFPLVDREELRFGTLMHLLLEAWWLAVKAGLPADQWLAKALEVLFTREGLDPFERVKAEAMMFGYHDFWKADADDYEVLGVERSFRFALVNPETGGRSPMWNVGGKLDLALRKKSDGTIGFGEHKTSSQDITPGSFYYRKLRLDSQVSTYFPGFEAAFHERAQWSLYDVLGKPGQRPLKATPEEKRQYKKGTGELYANQRAEDEKPAEYRARLMESIAEDPAKYFQRVEVVRLETELDEARLELWQRGAEIREARNNRRWPRNPEACMGCPYFGVCEGTESLDDPTRFQRSAFVHPELSEEKSSEPQQTPEAT
jgi:hypothetical protein